MLIGAALQPLLANELNVEGAIASGGAPLREFMLAQVRQEDLAAIYAITGTPLPDGPDSVDLIW